MHRLVHRFARRSYAHMRGVHGGMLLSAGIACSWFPARCMIPYIEDALDA